MAGKGWNFPEMGHVINALPPVDMNGGKSTDVWSMKNHQHASIIVQLGVSAGAVPTMKLQACDDFTPSNTTDLAFNVYKCETSADDQFGSKTAVANTGLGLSTNNNVMYVIEVDAAELPDGKPNLRVNFSDPSASVIGSVVAVLSGSRYANDQGATEIA
jgi:hypothetical protein